MVHVTYSKLMPFNTIIKLPKTRNISKYIHRHVSSKAIRQRFLDYFIEEHNHNFVKSSPVVPYCDPSVAFVNAGMNQFKGILLGTQVPPYNKVANSQKCIRVGGKHNDLNIVGKDGYHHTFFEMLGSWSFGDYYKKDACKMAWELLTNVYNLPKARLYVTYFKGDEHLGLEEDLETKEIWKQIGVPEGRILPFGAEENFWEMGLTGPCGPCTEIHIDHRGMVNRAEFVNKGLYDLTEIWNIVFIQYNRQVDGTVSVLPKKHVDTGMGLERLTSILQGKISNYDTDIFTYLINAIQKNSSGIPKYTGKFGESDWNHLDTSYRILADHTRMVTACLADGMIPEQNQKLRRVLRKAFLLSETVFKKDRGLLKELTNYVVENLGPVYTEMEKNIAQIHQIVNYEEEVYKSIREVAAHDWAKLTRENPQLLDLDIIESPSFISAYKEIVKTKPTEIDAKLAFKLYDTYGLDEDYIVKISNVLKLKFNPGDLARELEKAKLRSKGSSLDTKDELYTCLVRDGLPKTDDTFKYSYTKNEKNEYVFPDLDVKVLKIFEYERPVSEAESEHYCALLLDKTNLYSEAGGQVSDRGKIKFDDDSFDVTSLEDINGYILHKGFFKSDANSLKPDAVGTLSVDADFRLRCMRNHTGNHLLNAALKKVKGATCQKSSKVTDKFLNFDVAIFGAKLDVGEIRKIEKDIVGVVNNSQPVHIEEVNSQKLLAYDNITLIPGEIYPDNGIRVINIEDGGLVSREPCCGTHVLNTSDIEDFCIVNLKSLGRSTASIAAVTGDRAKLARLNANEIVDEIDSFAKLIDDNLDQPDVLHSVIAAFKRKLNYSISDESIIPIDVKQYCLEKLDAASKQIKECSRNYLRDLIEIEMQNALETSVKSTRSGKRYIVHFLRSSTLLDTVPLQKATKLCPDIPVLVISYADNMVKARCCVPKNLRTENFNAEKWLKETVAHVFKSRAAPAKGQDSNLVCNMKAKRIYPLDWDQLLNESMEKAVQFVEENL